MLHAVRELTQRLVRSAPGVVPMGELVLRVCVMLQRAVAATQEQVNRLIQREREGDKENEELGELHTQTGLFLTDMGEIFGGHAGVSNPWRTESSSAGTWIWPFLICTPGKPSGDAVVAWLSCTRKPTGSPPKSRRPWSPSWSLTGHRPRKTHSPRLTGRHSTWRGPPWDSYTPRWPAPSP